MRWIVVLCVAALSLVGVSGACAQTASTVTVQNKSHGGFLAARANVGAVMEGQAAPDARWVIEPVEVGGREYVRLKAANGLGYLNLQGGSLAVGNIAPGEPAALWGLVKNNDGSFHLQSHPRPNQYLNTQTGRVEVGPIEPGWLSADWVINPEPATASATQPPPPAAHAPAGAAASPGAVEITIVNERYPELDVIHLDAQNNQTLFGKVAKGQTIRQPATPGGRLAFAANQQWVEGSYTITPEPNQRIGFQPKQTFINGVAGQLTTGSGPASSQGGSAAASGGSGGLVEITITNQRYPELDVIHLDAQGNQTLFAKVTKGQTIQQAAPPNDTLAFAVNQQWVENDYHITSQASQTVTFNAGQTLVNGVARQQAASAGPAATPAPPAGSVAVTIKSTLEAPMVVKSLPSKQGDKPQALANIDARASGVVHVMPGVAISAYDNRINDYQGENYVVTTAPSQSISLPYVPPGTVAVTLVNTTASDLVCDIVSDKGDTTYLTTLPANQSRLRHLKPGVQLGFADAKSVAAGATNFDGMPYVVTKDATQRVNIPVQLTQAQLNAIAQQVATTLAQQNAQAEAASPVCWKSSYGRGAGIIPTSCNSAHPDSKGGLCYEQCRPGYTGALTMCVPDCPAGFRDDGLYCYKPGPVQRAAFKWEFGDKPFSLDDARARCAQSDLGRQYGCGTFNADTIVYSLCPPSYTTAPVITNLCTPVCPAGMTDIGISCQKSTYDRGVGRIPDCSGNTPVKDAGLCYKGCKSGYYGVGPVCWASCPSGWTDCGAMCGTSKGACATAITNQVTSSAMVALNVTLIAVTAGGAAGATAGVEVGEAAAEDAAKTGEEVAAEQAAKAADSSGQTAAEQTLKNQVRQQLVQGLKKAGKEAVIQTAIGAVIGTGTAAYKTIEGNKQFHDQVMQQVEQDLANNVTDAQIESAVNTAIQNAHANSTMGSNFDYTSLDPTGISSAVMSFVIPMCTDIKQ